MLGAKAPQLRLASFRAERVLYRQGGLLVVDKPVGIPVHGGDESLRHGLNERLVDFLASHRDATSSNDEPYLGVHHRLDQDTSGLLLFTTERAQNAAVSEALEKRTLERTYLAVVERTGRPLDASLGREGSGGTLRLRLEMDGDRAKVVDKGGKPAVTHYRVLETSGKRALIQLSLETGRTHQIRVSLAHAGAPVVGDRLYGGAPAERLMLHATRLSGAPLTAPLESPPPAAFATALAAGAPVFPASPEAAASALADAVALRAPLLAQTSTCRLVNREGDGLPGLTVDLYGDYAALNVYDAALLPRAEELGRHLLSLGVRGVHLKRRVKSDLRTEDAEELAPDAALVGDAAPRDLVVDERGLQLGIDLADGLSTGLFVDQRDNHFKARGWARAGRMLNLFCYTSSFSVAAALSGARTTSVDLSGKALERSRQNFALNGLDPAQHRFFKEDAMKFLARSVRRGDVYDFIVLDPPSFATVGKGTFSVKSRYGEAATSCLKLLGKRGRLLAVTNHTGTSSRQLRRVLRESAEAAGRKLTYVKLLPPGLDCPPGIEGPWPSKSAILEVE